MRISLLFVIVNVIALRPAAAFVPTLINWVNGVDKNDYPPIHQDVTFWCVKAHLKRFERVYLEDRYIESKLDFSKPINFVVHGWMSGVLDANLHAKGSELDENEVNKRHSEGWMGKMAIDWAHFGDSNVCIVDWSRLAVYDYATASNEHTRLVANFVTEFMFFLYQKGMKIEESSIAGHSLGAWIAGFIGASYGGRLNAIYGLDPAGLGFAESIAHNRIEERLDTTDAKYVQCIYTNSFILGTASDCGHGNFVMNGGLAQPGCVSPKCSHSRAIDYFTESLNPKYQYAAERCESLAKKLFLEFILKPCSDVVDKLGIHSERTSGSYFIKTNSNTPFAPNMMRLTRNIMRI